jgi:hypothetical protein
MEVVGAYSQANKGIFTTALAFAAKELGQDGMVNVRK